MFKRFSLLFLLLLISLSPLSVQQHVFYADNGHEITINSTNFPDDNFRQFVLENLDKSQPKDGILSESEIASVRSIDVSSRSIKDLYGIGFFTSLTQLNCSSNQITTLELSANKELKSLECYSNNLSSLRVNQNQNLSHLDCCQNNLQELRFGTSLDFLCCHDNRLTDLAVQNSPSLTHIECYNNMLATLDLSNNVQLLRLDCSNNKLKELDLSQCISLVYLNCQDNLLSCLDTSYNVNLPTNGQIATTNGENQDKIYIAGKQTPSLSTFKFFGKNYINLAEIVPCGNLNNIENLMIDGVSVPISDDGKLSFSDIDVVPNKSQLTYSYLTAADTARYIDVTVNLYQEHGLRPVILLPVSAIIVLIIVLIVIVIRKYGAKKA